MPQFRPFLICLFLALALIPLRSVAALAAGSLGGPGTASMGGVVDPDQDPSRTGLLKQPGTPGQERWYEAGNQNLTLQALYLNQKLEDMKVLDDKPWNKLNGDQTKEDDAVKHVAGLLGDACLDNEKNPGGMPPTRSSIRTCRDRYYRVQEPILRDLRERIKQNENEAAKLANVRGKLGPDAILGAAPVGIPGSKVVVPYVASLDDLKRTSASSEYIMENSGKPQDYETWATELLAPPDEALYKAIEDRNVKLGPGEKDKSYRVTLEDPNGKALSKDDVALKAAKDAYDRKIANDANSKKKGLPNSLVTDNLDFKQLSKDRKAADSSNKPAKATAEQEQAFNQARLGIINAVQKSLKIPSKSSLVFPGPATARSPSSGSGYGGGSQPDGKEQVEAGDSQNQVNVRYNLDDFETQIDSLIESSNPK